MESFENWSVSEWVLYSYSTLVVSNICIGFLGSFIRGCCSSSNKDKKNEEKPLLDDRESNPFRYSSKVKPLERAKMIVQFLLLIWLFRIVLLLISLLLLSAWSFACVSIVDHKKPLSKCTLCIVRFPVQFFSRMILFSLGYYYIPQKGVQDMRARVVAANHVTWIDAVYFMAAGSFSVVSKRGNAKGCLIGSIVRVQQPMLVDRDKTKKTKTLGISDIILNRTKDDRWPRILIFPQATTTRADCLTSFRTGGFRANSYVQGVALRYDIEPCCSCVDGLDVSWTNETPMLTVYLRLLLNCWNGLSVTWLPIQERDGPTVWKDITLKRRAKILQEQIANELNCPYTQHSYEDVKLWLEIHRAYKKDEENKKKKSSLCCCLCCCCSTKSNLEEQEKIIKQRTEEKAASQRPFHFVERLYAPNTRNKIPKQELRKLLSKFHEMDVDGNGRLSQKEFCKAHNIDTSKINASYLFSLLDSDGTGDIDFQEMLIGLILSDSNRDDMDKLDAMVYMFSKDWKDQDKKPKIDGKNAKVLLTNLLKLAPKTIGRKNLNDLYFEGVNFMDTPSSSSSSSSSKKNEEETNRSKKDFEGEKLRMKKAFLMDKPKIPSLGISASSPRTSKKGLEDIPPLPPKLSISATVATGGGIAKRLERLTEKKIDDLDDKKAYSSILLYNFLNENYPGLFDELRSSFVSGGVKVEVMV